MVSQIVKTFIGKHIDLSKVVSISDAYFINRMTFGGYYVGFEIEVQLLDKPIKYERPFEYDECVYDPKPMPVSISGEPLDYVIDQQELLAVSRLQKQIDELVEQWIEIGNTK